MDIRRYEPADLPAVVALSGQLGYSVTEEQAQLFLNVIVQDPHQMVFVAAEAQATVLGWVHIFITNRIFMPPLADLGGLVVDQNARGKSIGEQLMRAAEDWARMKGCSQLVVRSNVVREDAHRFYRRMGYELSKHQVVLRKEL